MDPSHKRSYVTYLTLPSPTVLPAPPLTLVYLGVLLLDYILVKTVPAPTRTAKITLYSIIATYHFTLPILFASKYDFGNISFMIQPWTLAAQIVYLAHKTSSKDRKNTKHGHSSLMVFKNWLSQMVTIATFQDTSKTSFISNQQIRTQGAKKILRGMAKVAFMKLVLDSFILPKDLSIILNYPFYSFKALFLTYALALKIYCMMSVMDIVMGTAQAIMLIRFHDLFDNPFMSTSPKDFWNRRWNRAVSRLYHRFIFTQFKQRQRLLNDADDKKKNDDLSHQTNVTSLSSSKHGRPSSVLQLNPMLCGLLVFFISGLVHDLMIAAAARVITFELTVFFLIHGVAVAAEVQCSKRQRVATNEQHISRCNNRSGTTTAVAVVIRVVRVLLTTLFFLLTGRLFINPILQHEVFLRIARRF